MIRTKQFIKFITLVACLVSAQPAQPMQNAFQYIKHQGNRVINKAGYFIASPKIIRPVTKIIGSSLLAYREASIIEELYSGEASFPGLLFQLAVCSYLYHMGDLLENYCLKASVALIIKNNDIDALQEAINTHIIQVNNPPRDIIQRILPQPSLLTVSIILNKPNMVQYLLKQGAIINDKNSSDIAAESYAQLLPNNTKHNILKMLNFYKSQQDLSPQITALLYKKQVALAVQEAIESLFSQSGSEGANDITSIIKGYL